MVWFDEILDHLWWSDSTWDHKIMSNHWKVKYQWVPVVIHLVNIKVQLNEEDGSFVPLEITRIGRGVKATMKFDTNRRMINRRVLVLRECRPSLHEHRTHPSRWPKYRKGQPNGLDFLSEQDQLISPEVMVVVVVEEAPVASLWH